MKAIYRVAVMVAMVALLTTMPVRASEMDDRIESSARDSYVFKTYLKGDDIKIQSKDGDVTLTGIVSDESHKSFARETVVGLPGVKSVDNRIKVKGEGPAENTDAWLMMKVKSTLLLHRSVSVSTTEVDVKDGIVTLRGAAASQAQKELTTEYAKDVEGVKDVYNEMTVTLTKTSILQDYPELKRATTVKTRTVGEKIDDASITAQIKMALLLHRSTSALNTKVETNDGIVTMYGKARNAAEKELVTKLVNDINGVMSINNQMTVE